MEAGTHHPLSDGTTLPAPRRDKRTSRIRRLVLLLVLGVSQILPADPVSAIDEGAADAGPGPAADDYDDDQDAEYADDGSRALQQRADATAPGGLVPISPIEEQGLLGNWGDADDEAED